MRLSSLGLYVLHLPGVNECSCPYAHHEGIWEAAIQLHSFLTPALHGGKWRVSQACRFTREGRAPRCPLNRGIVGPQRQSEDSGEEKKISCLCRESHHDSSVAQPLAYPLYQLVSHAKINDEMCVYMCWPFRTISNQRGPTMSRAVPSSLPSARVAISTFTYYLRSHYAA
jgi:hypothetical protein